MRAVLAIAFLLFACDKIAQPALGDDAGPSINVELEQEAQELDKLGVERDMLNTKIQITKEALGAATSELEDAKTPEQKLAAQTRLSKAKTEHEAATTALRRFRQSHAGSTGE